MNEIYGQTVDILITGGGITGGIIAVTLGLRKIWRVISSEFVNTTTDSATTQLINNLSDEIHRMHGEINGMRDTFRNEMNILKKEHFIEIQNLKKIHLEEKNEFLAKINDLEQSFNSVRIRNESMRAEALDAYAYITSNSSNCDPAYIEELKDKILGIAIHNKISGKE